ncbi:purine-nucleoside phosphorylase [Spirochaeta cellobiosiphila]|uniref:purine-nucleoside phosphorylase n=1 Tax=Spirochaeta cellobiosiphila TaxID=504483 RepID=UPI00041C77E9|nr:purine-nucleoside phosphorylase [Spirochaeta cellobiosiphila]
MEAGFKVRIDKAVASIRAKSKSTPKLGVILGSGLSGIVDSIEGTEISYKDIEGFPVSTVHGHKGSLKIADNIIVFAGRFHFYEGYKMDDVVMPITLMKELGVEKVLLTNAAGGVNYTFEPGDLAFIIDQVNLQGTNPLIGPNNDSMGPRFPDMSEPYNKEMLDEASRIARKVLPHRTMKYGVYAGFTGPSYETPAEIRMVRAFGGDLVGMSTVPECIVANYLGMKVCGISCVTNLAAGLGHAKLDHKEVIETSKLVEKDMIGLVSGLIEYWS